MIRDQLIESSENKNSSLMDLEVSIKIGTGCPFLIRFYGALFADVCEFFFDSFILKLILFPTKRTIFGY